MFIDSLLDECKYWKLVNRARKWTNRDPAREG